MNTNFYHFVAGTTLLLCACQPPEIELLDSEDIEGSEHDPVSETADSSGPEQLAGESNATPYSYVECEGTRIMVGILDLVSYPNASCNPLEAGVVLPPDWVWDTMFASGHAALQVPVGQLPDELAKYCMFTYTGQAAPNEITYPPFFATMTEWNEMAEVGPDCMGMAAAGDLNEAQVRLSLIDALLANIHMPDELPTCAGPDCAKVVVLDTEVGSFGYPGVHKSDHGSLVAGIIATIQGPTWDGDIVFENAFPGAEGESSLLNWQEGGDAGSMATLALGLFKSTWDWRSAISMKGSASRLVVNISLGFLRELTPGYGDGPAVQALRTALTYSSCSGALVLASAGNNTNEPCPVAQKEPLAPASLEAEAAPTDLECEELGFALPGAYTQSFPRTPSDPQTYNPLVFAVGGVDGQDRRLPNSRVAGQPRLVAYAAQSIGYDVIQDPGRAAMTGTSAAAAAATGVASVLWSKAPEYAPAQIMELIYQSGYDTQTNAEFQLGNTSYSSHRISYCAALSSLCDGRNDVTCPESECVAQAPDAESFLSDFNTAVVQVLDPMTVYSAGLVAPAMLQCEAQDMTQLLGKNPEDPVCPHCNIIKGNGAMGEDVVYMTPDPQYYTYIQDVKMTIVRQNGDREGYRFDPATISALNDSNNAVVEVLIDEPNAVSAVLHFVINDPTTGLVSQDNSIPVLF